MGRLLPAASLIRDQADFYFPLSSILRATGILAPQLSSVLFVNNCSIGWPLTDGTSVMDVSITAGSVYFNEISTNPGFYSVRFFPDRIGFWRLILTNIGLGIEIIKEYDVVPSGTFTPGISGLNASFVRHE